MDTKDIWERVKLIFSSSLTNDEKAQADRYFSLITSVSFKDNIFAITTSNSFATDFIRESYGEKLKQCFILAGAGGEISLSFLYENKPSIIAPLYPQNSKPAVVENKSENNHLFTSTMPLNELYTFDEFVRGPSNSWAYSAAKGVVEKPGAIGYNPLFIHGGTGLGKTHLMQAIGHELHKKNPSLSICYLTAETFLNEYVNALQNTSMQAFRDRYRKIDVLLIDDVQFLQKGKQCQEEFFNTFNTLTAEHKQIVMTSDVAPKYLPSIEERLISRFEGGMVQEIESPSYETRLAILKKKAENLPNLIPEIAITFIANNIKSHVRAIEGALCKINVYIMMNPTEILTNEILSYLLKDLIEREQTIRKITIKEIQNIVAEYYNISISQLLSQERTQSLVTPRQMAMYIARNYTTKSLEEIAKEFERKHATIVHGVKTIINRLENESDLKFALEEIISKFGMKTTDKLD